MAPSESMQIHLTYNNISEIPTIPGNISQVKSKYQSSNNLTEQKIEIATQLIFYEMTSLRY